MKMRNIKNQKVFIFFNILLCLTLNIIIFLLFQQHQHTLFKNHINVSIEKRINDYQKIFEFITEKKQKKSIEDNINLISHKTLHLGISLPIIIDDFSLKSSESLNEKERLSLSLPYKDESMTNEWLIDLTYVVILDDKKPLIITNTTLLTDILQYIQLGNKEILKINKQKTSSSFYIKSFNAYLEIPHHHNIFLIFLTHILAVSLYVLFLLFYVIKKNNSYFKKHELSVSLYEKKLSFLEKNNNKLLEITKHIVNETKKNINISSLIDEILYLYSIPLEEKNLKIFNEPSKVIITTYKQTFILLLWRIIDVFINEIPPNTRIYISIKNSNLDHSFIEIDFMDKLPISIDLHKKTKKNNSKFTFCPLCDIDDLSQKLDIFLNFSFSNEEGNTVIIAIPQNKDIITTKNKERSNVLFFQH